MESCDDQEARSLGDVSGAGDQLPFQGSSFPGSLDSILGWSLGQEARRPCLDRSVVQREGKSQASHCPSCLGLSPLHPESVMTRRPSAFPPLGDVVIKGQGRLGAGGHCLCYNSKSK